jgi:RimJ/RimL family protein N-acetyltransferase
MDASDPVPLPARPELSDGVVLLREPVEADVPAITAGASEPSVAQFTMVPSPYGESDAVWFVNHVREGWAAGRIATFAVATAADPQSLLGMIGLHDIDRTGDPGGTAEIGYWLRSSARGQGLMSRAVRLLSTWGVDELGLTRINWSAVAGNEASRNVVRSCGYHFEGTSRRGLLQRGRRLDAWIGGLLAEELIRSPEADQPTS